MARSRALCLCLCLILYLDLGLVEPYWALTMGSIVVAVSLLFTTQGSGGLPEVVQSSEDTALR